MQIEMDWQNTVKRNSPDTSRAAAQSVAEQAKTLRAQVVWALVRARRPMAAEELAQAMGLETQQVAKRLSDLRRLNMLSDSGQRFVNSSGRSAVRWRLC